MSKRHSTTRSFFNGLLQFPSNLTEQLLGASSSKSSSTTANNPANNSLTKNAMKRKSLQRIQSANSDELNVNQKVTTIMSVFRDLTQMHEEEQKRKTKHSSLQVFGDVFTSAFNTLSQLEDKTLSRGAASSSTAAENSPSMPIRTQLPISTLLVTESVDEGNGFLGDNLSTLIKLVENQDLKKETPFLKSWLTFFKKAVQNKFFCSFCSKFPNFERQLVRIISETSKDDDLRNNFDYDLKDLQNLDSFNEIVKQFEQKKAERNAMIVDCCEILVYISKKENFIPQKETIKDMIQIFASCTEPSVIRVLSKLFLAFSTKKSKVLKTIAKQSGINIIADKINKNKRDPLITKPLAHTLKNFSNHQQFRMVLGYTALDCVIEFIHGEDSALAITVLEILRNTCFVNEVEKLAMDKGYIDQLLYEMFKHQQSQTSPAVDEKLVEAMMAALRNVTSLTPNQNHIGLCGGVDLILDILQKYPKNNEISEHGCCSLRNLCVDCHENRARIHTLGGINTILNILRTLSEEKVVTEAITALWNFTFCEENCLDMLMGGIFEILGGIDNRKEMYTFDLDNGALRRWMPHIDKRLKKMLLVEYCKLLRVNSKKEALADFINYDTITVDCF